MKARYVEKNEARRDSYGKDRPIGVQVTSTQLIVLNISEAQELVETLQAAIKQAKESE